MYSNWKLCNSVKQSQDWMKETQNCENQNCENAYKNPQQQKKRSQFWSKV